jgi:hypothetical protein
MGVTACLPGCPATLGTPTRLMSGLSCDEDGKEVEVLSTPRMIPDVVFEWLLQFSLRYK